MLSNKEKLELINTIEVIECSANSFEEMEYILADDSWENREILLKVGMTPQEIDEDCCFENETIDLVGIGFKYALWYSEVKGFQGINNNSEGV